MKDAPQHGADAHIPSDTEPFDNVVEMKKQEDEVSRGMKELTGHVQIATGRCISYAIFYMANEENGLGTDRFIHQIYAQQVFDHANVIALGKLIAERLGITNKEILSESLKIVEENLFALQRQFGILITPQGVTLAPRNDDESNSQSGGEDAPR